MKAITHQNLMKRPVSLQQHMGKPILVKRKRHLTALEEEIQRLEITSLPLYRSPQHLKKQV